jgi:hypothetical protein
MTVLALTRDELLQLPPVERMAALAELSQDQRLELGLAEESGEMVALEMDADFERQMRLELGLD